MISTKPEKTAHLDIEPWAALMEFNRCADPDQLARLMFTTPENLKARLKLCGSPALIAARQFQAVWIYLQTMGWPQPPERKLSSRPGNVTSP